MKDLRSGIEHLKQAKAHMSEANGIMSDCISRLKTLEEENEQMKAEIALIQPDDSCMEQPKDADGDAPCPSWAEGIPAPVDAEGHEIPLDTKVLYDSEGAKSKVFGYEFSTVTGRWTAEIEKLNGSAYYVTEGFRLAPPDSWEKLEKDAMGRACELAGSGHLRCGDCEWGKEGIGCQAMAWLEILKRAKKLAGIEEEEQR